MINPVKPLYSRKEKISLKCSFYLFQMMGLAPVSFKNCVTHRNHQIINYKVKCLSTFSDMVYSIVCSTICLILNMYFNPFVNDDNYPDKSKVTDAIENCLIVSQNLSFSIMYISICLKRKTFADGINKLMKLDLTMIQINKYYKIDSSFNAMLVLSIYAIIVIGLYVSLIIGSSDIFDDSVVVTTDIILNMFLIEYAIILTLLIGRINSLNELIIKIGGRTLDNKEYIYFNTCVRLSDTYLIESTTIRQAMTTIRTISNLTAGLFSFPLLWNILYNSGSMLYTVYYLILPILFRSSEQTLSMEIHLGFALLLSIFPMIMLSVKIEKFKEEVWISFIINFFL